ncbi:MAG: alcohol dehydrogenase catalytic domain-containing protein [Pigmentiphaga sp.]
MKAVQLQSPGGPDVLELVDLPLPAPGPGQVRVRAAAIGAGGPDVLIRNGTYKWMPPMPAIPGNEMAGTIEALGAGVDTWKVGDRSWSVRASYRNVAAATPKPSACPPRRRLPCQPASPSTTQ